MYQFEWDPAKAASNLRKHGVSFEIDATVFRDSASRSVRDDIHSDYEERWITVGRARNGRLLVVSHTSEETGDRSLSVRLISARVATPSERRQYTTER